MIYTYNAECGEIFSQQSLFQPYRSNKFERDVLSKFEQLPSMTAVVTVSRKLLFHEVDELNVIAPSGIAE